MRKITKIRRSIRAISPVISVLLMIAIAVVASLVAYAWVMGYIGFQTAKTGQAVQVQSVAFNTDGSVKTVYLQNVGDNTVNIIPDQCLYINSALIGDSLSTSPTPLEKGDTLPIDAGTNGPFTPGQVVTVKVTTDGGTYGQISQVVPESGSGGGGGPNNNAPTAAFTFVATNLNVQFTDGSSDSDGTVASWAWNFGDAGTSTQQSPSHAYASAGTYTVRLTVTDDDGATNYVEHSVTVAAGNVAPTAAFTSTPTNLVVAFDGSTSSDIDGTIASYAWTFGDTGTGTGVTTSHTYAAAGTYTVRLTVTDDDDATNYIEHSVTVTAAPTRQNIFTDDFESTTYPKAGWTVDRAQREYADSTRGYVSNIYVSSSSGTNGYMVLQVDTTGYSSIELNYQRSFSQAQYGGDSNTDHFIVEWHVGTGSWTGATNIEDLTNDASWASINRALTGANGVIQIRFRLSNCESWTNDEAWINNVSVTGLA